MTPGVLGGKLGVDEVLGDLRQRDHRPPATFPVAEGEQALSFWGDLVAVAADTAVVPITNTQSSATFRVLFRSIVWSPFPLWEHPP